MDNNDFDLCQDALNRMRKAAEKGTGVILSADDIQAFRVTIIGEMWNAPDPRQRRTAIDATIKQGGGA